jgi:DNA-binding CsgD family transcriptional regulator
MSRPKLKATARQLQIVTLMTRGMPPKRIAGELGITVSSVGALRRRLLDRNGLRNDVELGMLVERCSRVQVETVQ